MARPVGTHRAHGAGDEQGSILRRGRSARATLNQHRAETPAHRGGTTDAGPCTVRGRIYQGGSASACATCREGAQGVVHGCRIPLFVRDMPLQDCATPMTPLEHAIAWLPGTAHRPWLRGTSFYFWGWGVLAPGLHWSLGSFGALVNWLHWSDALCTTVPQWHAHARPRATIRYTILVRSPQGHRQPACTPAHHRPQDPDPEELQNWRYRCPMSACAWGKAPRPCSREPFSWSLEPLY